MLCRDPNRVNEEWFQDVDAVRAAVGIIDEAPASTSTSEKVGHVPATTAAAAAAAAASAAAAARLYGSV